MSSANGQWVERPADLQPALETDLDINAALVGAGYAGLTTSLELLAAALARPR